MKAKALFVGGQMSGKVEEVPRYGQPWLADEATEMDTEHDGVYTVRRRVTYYPQDIVFFGKTLRLYVVDDLKFSQRAMNGVLATMLLNPEYREALR